MLHGQPTWSYLFRHTIPPLVEAGYRCIAFDYPGFGRSDKPADDAWYSYERHVDATSSLIEELDLRGVTMVLHDWGGPIGLRIATGPLASRVSRFVVMDTINLVGQNLGEAWQWFHDLAATREDFPAGRLVRMGCRKRHPRELAAAYEAPFPDATYKAGVRAFPRLIPLSPDTATAAAGREIAAALRRDSRRALPMWAEFDAMFPREQFADDLCAQFAAADDLVVVGGAGHFMFEDEGEQVGRIIAAWLDRERERADTQADEYVLGDQWW